MTEARFMPKTYEDWKWKLVEEIGELQAALGGLSAALGKAGRWGMDSYNPYLSPELRETNRAWVIREMENITREYADVREACVALKRYITPDGSV